MSFFECFVISSKWFLSISQVTLQQVDPISLIDWLILYSGHQEQKWEERYVTFMFKLCSKYILKAPYLQQFVNVRTVVLKPETLKPVFFTIFQTYLKSEISSLCSLRIWKKMKKTFLKSWMAFSVRLFEEKERYYPTCIGVKNEHI